MFDCLHDMGDPVGVAAHVKEKLADEGVWMSVEPFANDRIEENLTPVGRAFYSASTMLCTPNALNQHGDHARGAQAGEAVMREVVTGRYSLFLGRWVPPDRDEPMVKTDLWQCSIG